MPYCRCSRCEARRTLARHPDEYQRTPRCPRCGSTRWRIDKYRTTRERGPRAPRPCRPGRGGCDNYSFPHRRGSGYCVHNPNLTEDMMREREESGAWA